MSITIDDIEKSGVHKAALFCEQYAKKIQGQILLDQLPDQVISGLNEAVFQISYLAKQLRQAAGTWPPSENDSVPKPNKNKPVEMIKLLTDCIGGRIFTHNNLAAIADGGTLDMGLLNRIQAAAHFGLVTAITNPDGSVNVTTSDAGKKWISE